MCMCASCCLPFVVFGSIYLGLCKILVRLVLTVISRSVCNSCRLNSGKCLVLNPEMSDQPPCLLEEFPMVRVNDKIFLHFVGEPQYSGVVCPTYTHQIFDDEKTFLKSSLEAHITIELHDLHSSLEFTNSEALEDQEVMYSKIGPLLVQTDDSLPPLLSFPEMCQVNTFRNGGNEFYMYLVTHKHQNATVLLKRAEKLAMWFIETASSIDFADNKWEALFLVKKGTEGTADCFVGYYTLYTFHNPVKGSKMRVCQALVLPPYQGRGLGRELLQQVYRLAADREFVVEVTVEDPAPAFQCLRDAVDVEWMMRLQATSKQGTNSSKLTPAQLEFVKQCADYRRLCRLDSIPAICGTKRPCDDSILVNCPAPLSGPKHKGGKFSTEMKSFRLRVKKHLLVLHGDLRGLGRTDMQNELAVLYSEMEARFKAVCAKEWVWGNL